MTQAFIGAIAMAALSTLGDFIWATSIFRPRPLYGLAHGTLLFLCIGVFLGILARRPLSGAFGGALIGFLAAASFYVLAPLTGYWVMFLLWMLVWMLLAILAGPILRGRNMQSVRKALMRGAVAAISCGVAFYAMSGIWFPFNPHGWDYAFHFVSWTIVYLPGFAVLMVKRDSA